MNIGETVGFYMAIGGIAWSITTIIKCCLSLMDRRYGGRWGL